MAQINLQDLSGLQYVNVALPGQPENVINMFEAEISTNGTGQNPTTPRVRIEEVTKAFHPDIAQFNAISFYHECFAPRESCMLGNLLAVVGGNQTLVMQIVERGDSVAFEIRQRYFDHSTGEELRAVGWGRSPENHPFLAVGGDNKIVRVFDIAEGIEMNVLIGNKHTVTDVKFRPTDGRFLLTASFDYTIRLWNVVNANQITIFSMHDKEVYCVEWHIDSTTFASGGADRICVWSLTEEVQIAMEASITHDPDVYNDSANIPCARNPFKTLHLNEAQFATSIPHRSYVSCIKFYGNMIISRAQDSEVLVWFPNSKYGRDKIAVLHAFEYKEGFKVYRTFATAPATRRLLALANGKNVHLYSLNLDSSQPIATIRENELKSMRLAFNHEENFLAVIF